MLMYSASSSFALYQFNKNDTYFLFKHFIWLFIGFSGLLFLASSSHYTFKKYSEILISILSKKNNKNFIKKSCALVEFDPIKYEKIFQQSTEFDGKILPNFCLLSVNIFFMHSFYSFLFETSLFLHEHLN